MERAPSENSEIYDVTTLSPQTKSRIIFEIFDLGKDKDKNEERRRNFAELLGRYHNAYIKSKTDLSDKVRREKYESGRSKLHNEIMDIIKKMSLSVGLSKEQREVASYLAENRDEVTKMISAYFLGRDPSTSNSSQYLRMKEQLDAMSSHDGPEEE